MTPFNVNPKASLLLRLLQTLLPTGSGHLADGLQSWRGVTSPECTQLWQHFGSAKYKKDLKGLSKKASSLEGYAGITSCPRGRGTRWLGVRGRKGHFSLYTL